MDFQSSPLQVEIKDDMNQSVVFLRGDILEGAEFALEALTTIPPQRSVVFDLEQLGFINSYGVGGFARFMKRFTQNHAVSFIRCPQGFVDQAVLVPSMVGNGRVLSLYVNFECPGCGRYRLKLVDRQHIRSHDLFPSEPCPGCGKPMHIMVDADELDARFLG